MLAVPERVLGRISEPETLIWHKPIGRGDADFQPIACSNEEGIVLPGNKRDIPRGLDKPGERWCPDCLKLTKR